MTLAECTAILAPFAVACRADFDEPTFKAYHRVLQHVPSTLLEAALEGLMKDGVRFFPTAPELLTASEKARRQQLALDPWMPCCECEDTPRWRALTYPDGVRMEHCPCVARHRAMQAEKGLSEPIAALLGEVGAADSEQVYPTIDQLPAGTQTRVKAIAAGKVMR